MKYKVGDIFAGELETFKVDTVDQWSQQYLTKVFNEHGEFDRVVILKRDQLENEGFELLQ